MVVAAQVAKASPRQANRPTPSCRLPQSRTALPVTAVTTVQAGLCLKVRVRMLCRPVVDGDVDPEQARKGPRAAQHDQGEAVRCLHYRFGGFVSRLHHHCTVSFVGQRKE